MMSQRGIFGTKPMTYTESRSAKQSLQKHRRRLKVNQVREFMDNL